MKRHSLAPRLRHRIQIQSMTAIRDEHGGVQEVWTPLHASVPAEVVPLSGREFIAAAATQAAIVARITIRYMVGIVPAMRVTHDGSIYNIQAVLPDPTGRRHLTLMCEAGPQIDPPEQVELNQNWAIFTGTVDQAVNGELP